VINDKYSFLFAFVSRTNLFSNLSPDLFSETSAKESLSPEWLGLLYPLILPAHRSLGEGGSLSKDAILPSSTGSLHDHTYASDLFFAALAKKKAKRTFQNHASLLLFLNRTLRIYIASRKKPHANFLFSTIFGYGFATFFHWYTRSRQIFSSTIK
jgi:hypothetical protein